MSTPAIDFGFGNPMSQALYDRLAAQIEASKLRESEAIFDIGTGLVEAKKRLDHGTFLRFLSDRRVGYGERAAQLLMKIASAEDGRKLAAFGIAKAAQLLRVSTSQRSRLIADCDSMKVTVSQLRKLVDDLLGKASAFKSSQRKAPHEADPSLQAAWAAGVLQMRFTDLSAAAVDKAFRELAQVFHPDKRLSPDGKFMRALLEARSILKRQAGTASKAA